MAGVRDLKGKIKSVNNIAQITRAMKMIASSRIKKIEGINRASKPYAYKIREMTIELVNQATDTVNPLMEYREPKNILDVVISADKGLCGAYNQAIIKFAHKEIETQKGRVELIVLGRKAEKYFTKKKFEITQRCLNWVSDYNFAKSIANLLSEKFVSKEVDEVNCYYMKNVTSLTQKPIVEKILPVKTGAKQKGAAGTPPAGTPPAADYIFEPSIEENLNVLLARYLEVSIYSILLDARTSEFSARLRAMSNATDNAEKLTNDLRMEYFRARQEAITNEIIEVSTGAEASK